MKDILLMLKSPAWWTSVIIVGFIVNVLSSYFRDWLDRKRLALSKQKSARQLRLDRGVEELARDFQDRFQRKTALQLLAMEKQIQSVQIFLVTFFCLGVTTYYNEKGEWPVAALALLVAVLGFFTLITSESTHRRLIFRRDLTEDDLLAEDAILKKLG